MNAPAAPLEVTPDPKPSEVAMSKSTAVAEPTKAEARAAEKAEAAARKTAAEAAKATRRVERDAAKAAKASQPAESVFPNCPLCGFHFTRPKAKCGTAKACRRRKAIRDNGGVDPTVAHVTAPAPAAPADEVGKRRAARDANSTPPVVTDANVVKVSLGTTAQETMADQLFTDPAVATRSGRSLLISDQAAVVTILQDRIEEIDGLPADTEAAAKRVAAMRRRTMEALLGRVHAGLLVD